VPLVTYLRRHRPVGPISSNCRTSAKAELLLLECTFVEPDHVERARAGTTSTCRDLARVIPALE
jgi:hypothetical protein